MVNSRVFISAWSDSLAEDGGLKWLHLHYRAKAWFQLVHGGSEWPASLDGDRSRALDTDRRRWRRMDRESHWRLVEM